MMQADDIQKFSEGAKLAGFLPYLESYTDKMEKALRVKVFAALDKKELTPDVALYAWMELQTIYRLKSHFNQHVRIGQAAGERAAANGQL